MEVASRNVNSRAFDAGAAGAIEPTYEEIDISAFKDLLAEGPENVIAVQVHNVNLTSSDLSFIPKLISREVIPPTRIATVPVVLNEVLIRTSGERWVELYNTSSAPVDISAFHLTDDRRNLTKAKLPDSVTLPGRGRKAFTDTQLGLNFSLTSPAPRERVFIALVNPAGTRVVTTS